MAEEEKITLYHGTRDERAHPVIVLKQDLYGYRYPDQPNFSGSLTNNKDYAELCAWLASFSPPPRGLAVVLEFQIPKSELIDEGPIGNNPPYVRGFSTTHVVELEQLSLGFRREFEEENGPIQEYIDQGGKITFHRIPRSYFIDHHLVRSNYKV